MAADIEKVGEFEEDEEVIDYSTNLITLTDEDGVDHEFELVDTMEVNGENYVALLVSAQDDPQGFLEADGELIIMKTIEEDGEEILALIEDDDEFDAIGDLFRERLNDQFDFDEE